MPDAAVGRPSECSCVGKKGDAALCASRMRGMSANDWLGLLTTSESSIPSASPRKQGFRFGRMMHSSNFYAVSMLDVQEAHCENRAKGPRQQQNTVVLQYRGIFQRSGSLRRPKPSRKKTECRASQPFGTRKFIVLVSIANTAALERLPAISAFETTLG